MAQIVVEARKSPEAGAFLNRLSDTCRALGHRVQRWRSPRSGRVPYSRWMWPCDLAILFNGTHERYRPYHAQLDRAGTPKLFVELGWYPQQGHFQVDPHGINAAVSWAGDRLAAPCRTPLSVGTHNSLLVVLQHDHDTQITHMSPWFGCMLEFVKHLAEHSTLPLKLRKHPRHDLDPRLMQLAKEKGLVWDQSPSLSAALDACRAVACVNSSSAVEALARRLPVLCFGKAMFRHPQAVLCLTDDGQQLAKVTRQLAHGRCDLFVESVDEMVARISARQWTLEDIPHRLPPLIDSLLAGRKSPTTWWRQVSGMFSFSRRAA